MLPVTFDGLPPNPLGSNITFVFNLPTLVNDRQHIRFDGWSALARASYDWNDDVMTYVSWARGYQSGGYGLRVPTTPAGVPVTQPFDDEKIFSWEVGMKSRWWGDRLQLNGAAYYSQVKDQQVTTFVPGSGTATFTDNAGKSRIRGWELELLARPLSGLHIALAHSWTYATYSEFISLATGTPEDISRDRRFSHTPKRKWSGLVQYTFEPWSIGTLELTGSFVREGPKFWLGSPASDAFTKSDHYTKYDGRITLRDAFGRQGLSVALVGRNITDRTYLCCQGINFGAWSGSGYGYPRRLTVELGYEFGGS